MAFDEEKVWMADRDEELADRLNDLLVRFGAVDGGQGLRHFACACCRRIWHLLDDPRSRNAVEVAERHANGSADDAELDRAIHPAQEAVDLAVSRPGPQLFRGPKQAHANAAAHAAYFDPPEDGDGPSTYSADDAGWVAQYAAWATAHAAWLADSKLPWELQTVDWDAEYAKEREAQWLLFKEMFGERLEKAVEQGAAADRPRE